MLLKSPKSGLDVNFITIAFSVGFSNTKRFLFGIIRYSDGDINRYETPPVSVYKFNEVSLLST